jgi:hypothetical protein
MITKMKISRIYNNMFRGRHVMPVIILSSFLTLISGCSGSVQTIDKPPSLPERKNILPAMGFSIQVGAFSSVENAARLTKSLQEYGFDAYYFFQDSKLFKVRFGNYLSIDAAQKVAEGLRSKGVITEYLIISPKDYHQGKEERKDNDSLRKDIVLSAESFLGVPYYWSGISDETGFDCSGLVMAVYKLNGIDLPRTSGEQWSSGNPVAYKQLSEGDLVFFSIKEKGKISHVGIYVGEDKFIHAPGKGKKIKMDVLSSDYFQSHYVGARTFF